MTITLSGSDIVVTGGTSGSPITWDDIVAADTAGGWGRITTLNASAPKQYLVATDTLICIGDNSTATYVAVERCQITFSNGYFKVRSGATASNAVLRIGRSGSIYYTADVTMRGLTTESYVRLFGSGTLLVYGSVVSAMNHCTLNSGLVTIAEKSTFRGAGGVDLWGGASIVADQSVIPGKWMDYTSPVGNTVTISDALFGDLEKYNSGDLDVRNAVIDVLRVRQTSGGQTVYLYDCDIATRGYTSGSGDTPVLYYNSTLGLTVQTADGTPISMASVVVTDSDDNVVYSGTTDANGQIPDQDVLYQTTTIVSGDFSDASHTPHTVTITATGYPVRTLILDMSSKHVDVEVLGGLIVIED